LKGASGVASAFGGMVVILFISLIDKNDLIA